jgi:cytosine/uracil/thiamine/allantoin permease
MSQKGVLPLVQAEGWRWTGHLAALVAMVIVVRAGLSVALIVGRAAKPWWLPVLELAVGLAFAAVSWYAYGRWRPLMAEQVRADWEREKERERAGP